MTEVLLSADRPAEEDLFERGPLVEQLAGWVLNAPTADGFVIGVTGPWGSGKTTVLGLLEQRQDVAADGERALFVSRIGGRLSARSADRDVVGAAQRAPSISPSPHPRETAGAPYWGFRPRCGIRMRSTLVKAAVVAALCRSPFGPPPRLGRCQRNSTSNSGSAS